MCNVGKFVMYTDYVQHLDSAKHKEVGRDFNINMILSGRCYYGC